MQAQGPRENAASRVATVRPLQIRGRFFTAIALQPAGPVDDRFLEALDAKLRERARVWLRALQREIDVTNALIARSSKGQALDPNLFVAGGSLDAAGYGRLAAGDASGVPEVAAILEAPTLEDAEVAARTVLDRSTRTLSVSDSEGVGVILDFLRRKEMEIAKLRLIGRGKFYDLPTDQIRKEVQP